MTTNKCLKARARSALMGRYGILIGAHLLMQLILLALGAIFTQQTDNTLSAVIVAASDFILLLLAGLLQAI